MFDGISTSGKEIAFSAVQGLVETYFSSSKPAGGPTGLPIGGDASKVGIVSQKKAIAGGDPTGLSPQASLQRHPSMASKNVWLWVGAAAAFAVVVYIAKKG
jgi:hypothetical protein